MPNYVIRFDRGPCERFDAVDDAAARHFVREMLADEGAEPDDACSLYIANDGGRDDEEFIAEISLSDADADDDAGAAGLTASEAAQAAGE